MVKKKVANTVDPAQARQNRIERWRGSPEMLVGAVVASVATLALGYATGFGFGALVEQIRTAAIDSIFDDRGDDRGSYTVLWGTFGFLGSIAAGKLAAGAARRYQGRPSTPAFPVVLALAGHTVGTWMSSREWLPPLAVGTAVDPVFHEDEEWGFWAWSMYYADWWWPATMLAMTALAVVLIVRLARRHAEMMRELERLLTYGCRVPADVVEVKARISSTESGSKVVGATVTVSFVDRGEIRHWATCRTDDVGVATGAGMAEVLFDPERPTHEKSIFVALRRRPAVSDWLSVG
jgi:hypothetical protein